MIPKMLVGFSRLKEQGEFLGIAGKILGIAGKILEIAGRREERRLELRMVGQKFWCARTSKGLNSGPRVVASAGLVPTRV
jgi:hypothetical protein